MRDRNAALAKILADLDRCSHGRHRGDTCAGYDPTRPRSGCPGGISLGNPWLRPGAPIGYDYGGRVYVLPEQPHTSGDPSAWCTPGGDLPDGYAHPDDDPERRPRPGGWQNS